ncbi:SDR family oxidoreductase [Herbiconiux sp. KACC 21604]|uniref:SDR family oxidoreductase n=1 Tax=unclassified Herbiconiux TaxID=2618217 RepID=UPI001490EBD1|nr:SDR family oxidoreductase [Herbiconiux sp. SALV-R1]QJU55644.1 SDR family oxidoreductase [Herbiconiux sp. SALV-R1]WPO86844.1 SDR family oxidoreductase [Herbiconiux sp. KACC 21604]
MTALGGRSAFVTGGDSGIGLGIARALVAEGARVALCGLTDDSVRAAVAELSRSGVARGFVLDVRDREAFESVARELDESQGGIDILVNNAGVGFLTPTIEAEFEHWDWVLGINLTGVFNGVKTFVPRMLASGREGHVVSTASVGGLLGTPGGLYVAAKFGVVGLMEALRNELHGTRIGVSVLAPGIVRTNIADGPRPPGEVASESPGGASLDDLYVAPMEPDDVGRAVVAGILNDDLYILTHGEHRPFLAERFEAILASLPPEPAEDRRSAVERIVLASPIYAEAKARREGR